MLLLLLLLNFQWLKLSYRSQNQKGGDSNTGNATATTRFVVVGGGGASDGAGGGLLVCCFFLLLSFFWSLSMQKKNLFKHSEIRKGQKWRQNAINRICA